VGVFGWKLACCCFFAVQFVFVLVSLFVVVFLVLDVVSLSVAYLDATAAVFPD